MIKRIGITDTLDGFKEFDSIAEKFDVPRSLRATIKNNLRMSI